MLQRGSSPARPVDMVDVPTTQGLHDLGHAVRVLWRHEQVGMIGSSRPTHAPPLRTPRIRIGAQDLRIAAIALLCGFTVVTGNVRDFSQVPGLN